MLPTSLLAVFTRVVLLPLLLALAVVWGLGSYFETNDDGTLAWLFSGVLALKPVPSVPLYLHGYGHLLAAAYTAAPAGPWLGLLLAALLAAASALWFAVLERLLRPWLRPNVLLLALALFFGLAWLEHWLWFSHVRVAVLLAAGGVLFAAQRAGRRGPYVVGLLAVLAAWLVRPGGASLGVLAVVSAALLLAGSWRRAAPLLLSAVLLLGMAFAINEFSQTSAEARAQSRDARQARILDFEQLHPSPATAVDSLGTATLSNWFLGDSAILDPLLRGPVYRFDAAGFAGRVVPLKLTLRAGQLLRDYFPVLLALLATGGGVVRPGRAAPRGFWLVQVAFVAVLAALAGFLKLPPRLALPLLDCWLLTNLVFWLQPLRVGTTDIAAATAGMGRQPIPLPRGKGKRHSGLLRLGAAAVLLAVVSLYGVKTWHRHRVLQQERQRHERALAALRGLAGRVRVLAGTNDFLKSLSPFRSYSLGPGPVLLLTGWSAQDASQIALRRDISGSPDQTECLRRLAARPAAGAPAPVLWVLTPETAAWLSRRTAFDGPRVLLLPLKPLLPPSAGSAVWLYQAALQAKKM